MVSKVDDSLFRAAIAVAARYGYGGATVARIVAEAGVSRATFYERFADRDECFLSLYRQLATAVEDELEAGLGRALEIAHRDPAAARVLLIESLAASPAVRSEHEQRLERLCAVLGGQGPASSLPGRAIVGGVVGVIGIRVFRGETEGLLRLREDLERWIACFATPTADSRWIERVRVPDRPFATEPLDAVLAAKPLPRGRGALAQSAVADRQRRRILAAVARLSRETGYMATTVADVVALAGVPRRSFYRLFRSKEDAFLASQAFGLEQSVSLTAGRFFSAESWPDRVWKGLVAALGYIAAQPDLVYVDLVESYAAGPAAIRRSFENRMAFTLFLEQGFHLRPENESLPRVWAEAIAGAIHELMRHRVVSGRSEQILELLPLAAYICLAPFLGPAAAKEAIAARASSAGALP